MQLAAEARNRVDAPLVADEPGDVAVVPPHEKGSLAGLRDDAVPRAAVLVAGISDTLERDVLGGADRQHDGRRCILLRWRLQLGRHGWAVGLVRPRKCAERGIA